MPDRSSKRPNLPRDTNQRAFAVVTKLTGTAPPEPPEREKDPAAVSLGRRGRTQGRKGQGGEYDARGTAGEHPKGSEGAMEGASLTSGGKG